MRNKAINIIVICITLILSISCKKKNTVEVEEMPEEKKAINLNVPQFNADSAYSYIQKQVDFGPRIPNSVAHKKCADYLINKLKSLQAEVVVQDFEETSFDGKKLKLKNIIGSFKPDIGKRILLGAHWDTRPFSENDKENPKKPSDGANDGASGVGALLEIARILSSDPSYNVGVDVIFFDGEDYGDTTSNEKQTWCLGSQYWARNRHIPNYSAYYGIVLDMVGAKGAKFLKEEYSMRYAKQIVNNVWEAGQQIGYGDYFLNGKGGAITDDHRFINEIAKIPVIDIIELHPGEGFGDYHHTLRDNMEIIDKTTLKAVGQTVLYVLYSEAGPGNI